MRIRIPSNGKFNGIYPSDSLGNIWMTKNIDLERAPGKIMLADSLMSLFKDTSAGGGSLITPVAFLRTAADNTDRYWALGGLLYKTTNTNPQTGWAADDTPNTPTAPLYDMIEFLDALIVATATNLHRLAAGTWKASWWSTSIAGGGAGGSAMQAFPHRFCIFSGALLITDGQYINTWDGTLATDPALTLPADQQMDWIRAMADYAVMGGQSVGGGGEADVFFWDRSSASFNARYGSGDSRIFACFIAYGIPYIITRKGEIKKFTGQGFRTIQEFPCKALNMVISNIHPNGVVVDNNIVKILVTFGASTIAGFGIGSQRILDGLWTFNVDSNNLYHSGSFEVTLDYGQTEMAETGAIIYTNPSQGRYLIGGRTYTAYTGTAVYSIQSTSSSESPTSTNRGYIITPKIRANDVRRFLKRLFLTFRRFDASTDRIRIMYQIQEDNNLPVYSTITWVTSTTFTSSNTTAVVGDFIEIISGTNAGALAKITTIVGTTFTIDLTLNASTANAQGRFLKFIDLGTISSQAIQSQVFNLARRSEWHRFIIELRGTQTSPQLESILLDFDEISL